MPGAIHLPRQVKSRPEGSRRGRPRRDGRPVKDGAALCAVQAFSRRENLDAGRIQFARADEGAGAPGGPWPAGASAGTQAEDALTMKRLYQAACG